MNNKFFSISVNFLSYCIYLLPILLVTGPFLPDLFISICSVFFLIICFIRNDWRYFNNIFFKIFVIFYFYIVIRSLFYSIDFYEIKSSIFYIRFGVFSILIYYLCDFNVKFSKIFFKIIFFTILFLTFDAFIQYFFNYNLIGIEKYSADRISGFFGANAKLGSYMARLFPLSLIYFFLIDNNKNNLTSIKYYLFTIFIFLGILITGERTALFLFLLSLLLIYTLNKNFIKLFFLNFIIFFIISFVFIKFDPNLKKRLITHTKSQINITEGKLRIFSEQHESHYLISYKMFKDNIFFGQGPNSFRHLCSNEKFKLKNNFGCATHPHNIYIQALAEIGFVGFFFLFLCFIFIYFNIIKNITYSFIHKTKKNNFHLKILLTTISLSLFPLVPTGNFFNNWMSAIFYLPIGFFLREYFKNK